jgi:hypothetical protein
MDRFTVDDKQCLAFAIGMSICGGCLFAAALWHTANRQSSVAVLECW